jgi:hypothetical protein
VTLPPVRELADTWPFVDPWPLTSR